VVEPGTRRVLLLGGVAGRNGVLHPRLPYRTFATR
jgi:hypothetical protein